MPAQSQVNENYNIIKAISKWAYATSFDNTLEQAKAGLRKTLTRIAPDSKIFSSMASDAASVEKRKTTDTNPPQHTTNDIQLITAELFKIVNTTNLEDFQAKLKKNYFEKVMAENTGLFAIDASSQKTGESFRKFSTAEEEWFSPQLQGMIQALANLPYLKQPAATATTTAATATTTAASTAATTPSTTATTTNTAATSTPTAPITKPSTTPAMDASKDASKNKPSSTSTSTGTGHEEPLAPPPKPWDH